MRKIHFQTLALQVAVSFCALFASSPSASAKELSYWCSEPPLEVKFAVVGGHYNGTVNRGNLFLQTDIQTAPVFRWKKANAGKLYTLIELDFDGNANGSYPDSVSPGENAPVRHWIVGNIPGELLRGMGYMESATDSRMRMVTVLQPYRPPHIPLVSDRYGLYLFEQKKKIDFAALPESITNFDYLSFIETYQLGEPKASNFFVAIYTSESPFSGKAFHGNDVSQMWHHGYGTGKLRPSE